MSDCRRCGLSKRGAIAGVLCEPGYGSSHDFPSSMNRYFIDTDGDGEPTIWSRNSEDDPRPQPVACRWRVTPEAWTLLVEAVNARESA